MQKDKNGKSRRGSEIRKKSLLVTSRYSPEEFQELEEAASRAGLTRASYQRVQSLGTPKTRSTRRAPIERELLAKTQGHLGKIGSNLNQIARAANSGDGIDQAELSMAIKVIEGVSALVMRALGHKV
jgi:hypothetical protein